MTPLTLLTPALALLTPALAGRSLEPTMRPDEVVEVTTDDGWKLALRHYAGVDTAADGPPVLLVHGMWVNHYNWDYRPEVSLVDYLSQEGFDVWVANLRGDPGTTAPSRSAEAFTFDDHARYDLPALVAAVQRETGRDRIGWVGHSMGGMLLHAYVRDHPDDIAAGVVVSSPAALSSPARRYRVAARLDRALVGRRVRASRLATTLRLLGPHSPAFRELSNDGQISWPLAKGLSRHAVVDLPRAFVRDATRWVESGEIQDSQGDAWVVGGATPLLALSGAGDKVIPAEDVAHACAVYDDCEYRLLGVEQGFAADYGHADILLGADARAEVYPLIGDFLAEEMPMGG